MTPAASVVIVAHNGARFVRLLLDSLRAQTFRDFQVILVDNASMDDTAAIVAQDYPEVELVRMDRNLHFAAGNNEGYRRAKAPIVVLLNQDTRVGHDWLEHLLRPLLDDSAGALVCTHAPVLNEGDAYATSSARFDADGAKLATLSVAGRNCQTGSPFDPSRIFYGSGAALAVRKSAAGESLFDPDYRAYAEDVALGWRLRAQGGRILLVADAPVHHALPPEGRPSSPELLFMWERNRLYNLYIHYATRTRWLLHPVFAADVLALALPKPDVVGPDGARQKPAGAAAGDDRRRRRAMRRAVGRAVIEAIARNRELQAKHGALERLRRAPDRDVTAAMTARLTPFDNGLLGLINRFSAAWCRAFGVVTVESGEGALS